MRSADERLAGASDLDGGSGCALVRRHQGRALAAEAVVFFDAARGADMAERRKRGGHLVSKHRFIAAQIEAYLAGDLVARAGASCQRHGRRLAAGLAAAGLHPVWPVKRTRCSSRCLVDRPAAQGRRRDYYPWTTDALPDVVPARDAILMRLVTSFATTADEVDRFVAMARAS